MLGSELISRRNTFNSASMTKSHPKSSKQFTSGKKDVGEIFVAEKTSPRIALILPKSSAANSAALEQPGGSSTVFVWITCSARSESSANLPASYSSVTRTASNVTRTASNVTCTVPVTASGSASGSACRYRGACVTISAANTHKQQQC
eukprot:718677-Rhodomonas_salina.2